MQTTSETRRPVFEHYLNIFSVFFAFGFVLVMVVLSSNYAGIVPQDYAIAYYQGLNSGNLQDFYYPRWIMAVLLPFVKLPLLIGYMLWASVNIVGLLYAIRVFGGKPWLLILNYQFLVMIYYGQIVGLIAAGIAFYWVYVKDKPVLAGIGAIFALAKPHVAIPILLTIGMVRSESWRNRILSTVPVFAALLVSLIFQPTWINDLLTLMASRPPNPFASIALWHWIGPLSLVLWIAVFLPMSPKERLIMVTLTSALALPYYQQTGLVILYSMPVGYLPLLGNLGFLFAVTGNSQTLGIAVMVPIVGYVVMLYRIFRRYRQSRQDESTGKAVVNS